MTETIERVLLGQLFFGISADTAKCVGGKVVAAFVCVEKYVVGTARNGVGALEYIADEAFGHNRSLDEIQQGAYGQAALENTPNLMTCRIDLNNDKFVLYYPGDSLTRMVLLSLHEMFIRELPLLKICPNCGYSTTEDFEYCPKCDAKL